MFDKLVESDTTGAEFKNRSRYFMVSSVVVGILFLTAVVYSLYAADIGIGNGDLEIAELVSPIETSQPEPENRDRPVNNASDTDDRLVRRVLMEDTATATRIPDSPSVSKNPYQTISPDRFRDVTIGSIDKGSGGRQISGPVGSGPGSGSGDVNNSDDNEGVSVKDVPPPVIKKPPTILRTSKVLNGEAVSLPKPAFPRPAIMLNLAGAVKVQVTIDESGNVISAKAADGHPLFRQVAERAARNARFKPTFLNEVPVKVTGVIVYNFTRAN